MKPIVEFNSPIREVLASLFAEFSAFSFVLILVLSGSGASGRGVGRVDGSVDGDSTGKIVGDGEDEDVGREKIAYWEGDDNASIVNCDINNDLGKFEGSVKVIEVGGIIFSCLDCNRKYVCP